METDSKPFCPLFQNSTHYQEVVVDIRVGISSFSFLGSLFVITLIWLFKKYKFFVQRLILYLSLAAFLSSIAYILGRVNYDPTSVQSKKFCEVQGFLLLYTDWTVLLSILSITLNLLITVFLERKPRSLELMLILMIFFLPLAISSVPFFHSSFGPSGAWCWIRSRNDDCTRFVTGEYLQFAVWYVPQYVIIILLFILYIAMMIRLKTKVKAWEGMYDPAVEYKKSLIKKEINPLLWYPTVYFLITILPLVNRIVSLAVSTPVLPLYILHVLTSPLQGALTALVYALDRDTLHRLNWRNIRASFKYRNTDNIVREYPVGPASEENYPFIAEQSYHSISSSPHSSRKDT